MPTYDPTVQDKLDDLQSLTGAERKPAEIVAIYWPSPTGTKIYAAAMYTELPWWPDLAAAIATYFGDAIPITLTLIPDRTPFIDLPRAASISDDSTNLTFSDLDDEFSDLLMDHGEGLRCEVFCYWPAVDLLLSMWRGMLHQPKEMNRDQVKITATSGWRAPQMLVPKRPFATSCPFIFGAFYDTQEAIDQAKGCPYNAHLTELERGDAPLIGVPGFTDCPRRVKADCFERLTEPDSATQTEVFWPGFETREDPIPNNQTKGPNLLAKAIGNESALSDPIRVIAGERYVKALYLLAFRNETDTNHPEDGFGAALFAVSEGSNLAMWEFRINDQLVGTEHFQIRLGELGQEPTDWSPDVNSYSGTAHCYGRIQGRFDEATASDYSGSIRVLGATDVRVYSDPNTFTEIYTTNRAWWLLHVLAHLRWGYGQDYPRFDIQSFIDTAEWCDENVTLTDAHGNTFSGVRSTFNAEVTPRAIQQQVKDICTAGRLGIPFEFEGKDVVVPLRAEDVDDPNIPTFTDEGPTRNIIYDGAKSSLSWSVISDESMTNQWTVNFDDASNGGVDTQFIFGDQAQQLRAGRAWGDRSRRVVNKSQAGYGINSAQEAARFGNSLLYLGPLDSGGILNPFSVKFTTWYSEAFNVQNYKLIKVVNAKLQSRMIAYFTARGLEPYPGADFTCFRVMKYTRKGDLRVEIEAQQYATLEESPTACVNETGIATYSYAQSEFFVGYHVALQPPSFSDPAPDFVTWSQNNGSGGFGYVKAPSGTQVGDLMLAEAYTTNSPGGSYTWPTADFDDPTDWTLIALPLADNEGSLMHGGLWWKFADEADAGATPPSYFTGGFYASIVIYRGTHATDPIDAFTTLAEIPGPVDHDLPSITISAGNRRVVAIGRQTDALPQTITARPTGYTQRNNETLGLGISDNEFVGCGGGGAGGTFSAPRDLTAVVTASTGEVNFHWSPPATHPELVTGYTLYASDGVTVVMPTALVFDFQLTLDPGTYTYRLNATDGVSVSAFVSVTFTVPAPPEIAFNIADFPPNGLSQTTDTEGITTIRGGAVFGASEFERIAHVRVNGPSDAVGVFNEITTITPNSEDEAVFEFPATESGVYTVQLEVCFTSGTLLCNPVKPEAQITIALGGLLSLLAEDTGFLITEDATAFISLEF